MKNIHPILVAILLPGWLWAARPLTEATFTQVINNVNVLPEAAKTPTPAKLNALFKTPDLLRTGVDSLAELTAADETITRVGANTVFSFEADGRNINLQQGSLLFHSPKGKGGGTIKTRSASAAVLGTTIVIVATVNGGFKAIVLEGRGQIRLPNGNFRILQAGQLVFVLPDAVEFGPVLNVNLDTLVKGSRLINGFQAKLPSVEKIQLEVVRQLRQIAQGKAEDTGLLVGDNATKQSVQTIDPELRRIAVSETKLANALRTDAIIDSRVLNPDRVFLDLFTYQYGPASFKLRGFVARKITIDHPYVDLSPYTGGGLDSFSILAAGEIEILSSVTFQGSLPSGPMAAGSPFEFSLTAAGGFNIAPGIEVFAQGVGDFALKSGVTLDLNGVFLCNLSGFGVELTTTTDSGQVFGDIRLSNSSVSGAPINVHGDNVSINSSSLFLASGGGWPQVDVSAAGNLFIVNTSHISGLGSPASAFLKAGNDLGIVDSTIESFGTVNLAAGNILSVNNATVTSIGNLNLDARTIVLQNVDISSTTTVTLYCQSGFLSAFANTGAAIVPGNANFIQGVSVDGVLFPPNPTPISGQLPGASNVTVTQKPGG